MSSICPKTRRTAIVRAQVAQRRGYFCAYSKEEHNETLNSVGNPETGHPGTNKDGVQIFFNVTGAGAAYTYGTWAVTAP